MLLATVTCAKDAKEDVDFMPLSVEYKEKYAAAGRYPGGFLKREGRASDSEILVARLVDRALRPLFPDDFHAEVFVNVLLISADKQNMPDSYAGLAASAALAVSDVPWHGPISEVRVARIGGEFVINPTFDIVKDADIDLIVAATEENIMMVEGEMNEVSEAEMLEAIKCAHEAIKGQCRAQKELMEEVGKVEKKAYCHEVNDEDLRKAVHDYCYDKCYAIAKSGLAKHEREDAFDALKEEFMETIPEEEREEKAMMVSRYYGAVEKEAMRRMIIDEGVRLDGRTTAQIRPIWCEVGYLPGAHGSAIFTRAPERCGPQGDRSRQPGMEGPQARSARGRGESLRCPRGVRYPRVQRLFFHGYSLRRYFGPDGLRCEDQEARSRYRHGSDFR